MRITRRWLQKNLALWADRRHAPPTRLVELTLTFQEAGEVERAEALLNREPSLAAMSRSEMSVVALLERPSNRIVLTANEARRIRARLLDGGLNPLDVTARRGRADRERTIHRLRFVGEGRATPAERAVLETDEARLLPAHTEVAHPEHPRLVWTDVPEVARLNLPAGALGASCCFLWSASLVELSTDDRWMTRLVALAIVLVAVSAVTTWRSLDTLDAVWRSVCRVAVVVALPGSYGLGLAGAHTAPAPLTWHNFMIAVAAVVFYVLAMLWAFSLWRAATAMWRRVGGAALATLGALGVLSRLGELPRDLVQRGLGWEQTPLALPASSVLASMEPSVALGAALMVVTCAGTLLVLGAKAPGPALTLMTPVIVALGATGPVLAGAHFYQLGVDLRSGQRVEVGQIARCVRVASGDEPAAITTWSAPRVLVGASTGPSLLLDPARPGTAPVVAPEALIVQPATERDCGKRP